MPTKQTIAVIGAASAEGRAALAHLLPAGHRLLLMDEAAEKLPALQQQLQQQQPLSDTDMQPCCREACWEADIIILAKAQPSLASTLQKIKEVATTKTVVCLLHNSPQVQADLKRHLPYSKIVFLQLDNRSSTGPVITGENKAAVEITSLLFGPANINE